MNGASQVKLNSSNTADNKHKKRVGNKNQLFFIYNDFIKTYQVNLRKEFYRR